MNKKRATKNCHKYGKNDIKTKTRREKKIQQNSRKTTNKTGEKNGREKKLMQKTKEKTPESFQREIDRRAQGIQSH